MSKTLFHSKCRERPWWLPQCLNTTRYNHSSPGSVLSGSAARAARHRPESSMTRRAYFLPPLVFFVMPLKMDLRSSGDGPVPVFHPTLLLTPGMGSFGVHFVLTRSSPERSGEGRCCLWFGPIVGCGGAASRPISSLLKSRSKPSPAYSLTLSCRLRGWLR